MGVKDLWTVLSSVREECPLRDLAGKRIAIDLSSWIFTKAKGIPPSVHNPHLRNLFFRVRCLLQAGAELVVVLDGQAAQPKQATLEKRRTQLGMSSSGSLSRPRLDELGEECRGLLDALGVPCVRSRSEAESLCALLNSSGRVDGVITDDSDVFLYGATVVYNLSMEQRNQHVSCYRMSRIRSELGLSRSALVSLALLLGCDYYPGGVPGVGKESALKLLHSCREMDSECDLLQRLREWREHPGGEVLCPEEDRIRRKARKVSGFPSEEVIREFLEPHDAVPDSSALQWRMPQIGQLESYCAEHMHWRKKDTNQSAVGIVTQWVMRRVGEGGEAEAAISAECIIKQRTKQWVTCYDVQWAPVAGTAGGRARKSHFETCEDAAQFTKAYPLLTDSFKTKREEERAEKVRKRKSRQRNGKATIPNKQLKLEFKIMKTRGSPAQTSCNPIDIIDLTV